jgi:hypothetical protein
VAFDLDHVVAGDALVDRIGPVKLHVGSERVDLSGDSLLAVGELRFEFASL